MTQEEILAIVLNKLEHHNIDYVIGGSFASNIYGIPRATHDADIVIDTDKLVLERFMESFENDFYADKTMALDSFIHRSMFNIIHLMTGFKIDIFFRKPDDFSEIVFKRKQRAHLTDKEYWFSSAEDTILAKLEWYREGQSERQFLDSVNIARVQGKRIDRSYLIKWAAELNVSDLLQKIFDHIDFPETH